MLTREFRFSLLTQQNLYLISINVTNKLKAKFYHEYVPEVIDVSHSLLY
jgi:hypothetical protein